MAADGPQAIQRSMSRHLTIGVGLAALLLAGSATPALAASHPPGGNGVRSGADGYTPWANMPGSGGTRESGTRPPVAKKASTSCYSDGMGGCLMPRCGDPLATGICNAPAGPGVTPAQLARQAQDSLFLPVPDVRTAPPRGRSAVTWLPEWVWVPPSRWHPLSKRASAGAVWARATATPRQLIIEPGAGLSAISCGGPGTAYDPSRSAQGQRTNCSYTYRQSSFGQPGGAYRVRVTVVWGGTWVGSGGAGGVLPNISRSTTFALRVIEGQGLYG